MTTFIRTVIREYQDLVANDKYADPRTKNMFLVSHPFVFFSILLFYLYFSIKLGPLLMRNRKPFELRKTLIVYNFCQVLVCIYLAWEGTTGWYAYEEWFCQPLDPAYNPKTARELRGANIYCAVKMIDLLDTLFFVLRKKQKQITFLHLYHHTIMPIGCWVGLRYLCCGHPVFFGIVNSYVHIVMYTYYLIAALGPKFQKYLWWKKYVTIMQLVQFIIVFIHHLIPLFTSCTYPKILHMIILVFAGIFIYLFASFYVNAYVKKSEKNNVKKN